MARIETRTCKQIQCLKYTNNIHFKFQDKRSILQRIQHHIYDSIDDSLQHEPKHRLVKNGLKANVEKPIHESKNRAKTNRNIKTPKTK